MFGRNKAPQPVVSEESRAEYERTKRYVTSQWESVGRTPPKDHLRDLAERYNIPADQA
jgi:hypothetical protein